MRKTILKISVLAAAVHLVVPGSALATNGYSSHGFGTRSKAMAGAGVAVGLDALSAGTNPAAMAVVGDRVDVGVSLFAPDRGFTADPVPAGQNCPPTGAGQPGCITAGQYDSENSVFLIPSFGWNKSLDSESSVGISVAGNGGMNTQYNKAVFGNFNNPAGQASSPTGIDLSQLWIGPSYTRRVADGQWLGIMPVFALQRLKITGLEPLRAYSQSPADVSNNGYEWSYGYGLRLGWLGQVTNQLSLGASYQTRTYMTRFEKYAGILAGQGDFDVPPTLIVGLSYKATPNLTVLLDFQHIWYGDVKALANSGAPTGPFNLGGDDGLGFGWKDQSIIKLGAEWKYNPDWTLRAGYSHATAAFPGSQAFFNILAPATVQDHLTAGFSYRLNSSDEISTALTHAFDKRVSGSNPLFTGAQTGYVEMNQTELEVSWSRRF